MAKRPPKKELNKLGGHGNANECYKLQIFLEQATLGITRP